MEENRIIKQKIEIMEREFINLAAKWKIRISPNTSIYFDYKLTEYWILKE